jgi:hypothetical protein
MLGFGDVENCRFLRCKVEPAYIGFDGKSVGLIFEDCDFYNPDSDPNHQRGVASYGEMTLIGCKAKNFAWSGHKKLTLRRCASQGGVSFDTALPGLFSDKSKMPYSDFLIEDCDLRGGVEMINAELNSLIFRRNRLNEFALGGAVIKGNALFEEIKEGFLDLAATDYRGGLIVRNCSFSSTREGFSFKCGGMIAAHTLLENITCGRSLANVSGSFDGMTKEDRLPQIRNKSLVIRNCKIPHLQANWAQTEHLRIENCEFDSLHIEDGRIGKLEIIGCSLSRLNVSRTQVKEQNVGIYEGSKYSGHITTTDGSNIKLVPRD